MSFTIPQRRLHNQLITYHQFKEPQDVVSWFGAMQAQDFAAAKWALALRTQDQTNATIEQAFNEGKILRTHVMRPTWHFVSPQDIRWLLALTSPRVHRFNGYYYRQSGLDKSIFEKSNAVIKKALQGGIQLTREELNIHLKEAKIPTENIGLSYTIMQAELDGIIVSGPRRGKKFTYMLLDERVPPGKDITNDEALAELTRRYFQSHGPAQAQDFSWWSGLTMSDVRKGIDLLGSHIQQEDHEGKMYYFTRTKQTTGESNGFLIPGFDEFFIAYKDRNDILAPKYAKHLNQGGGMVNGAVVVEGLMVGGWKRTLNKKNVALTITLYKKIPATNQKAIIHEAERFGSFLHLPIIIN